MVTRSNLLYSAAAASRILGIVYQQKITVQEWFKVVWVWVRGYRPRFMSKAIFKEHFVQWRRAAARALTVTRHLFDSHCFSVRNETRGSLYQLTANPRGIQCPCEDYQNQIRFFGQGCCKHGYAVLSLLGFSSLQHYLSAKQPIQRGTLIPGVIDRYAYVSIE